MGGIVPERGEDQPRMDRETERRGKNPAQGADTGAGNRNLRTAP